MRNKLIYGVGINDANYQVAKKLPFGGESRCPYYKTWKNMFARCHSKAFQRNQPTYLGCSVDERWHSFMTFREWMMSQEWEGKHLDKDILVLGNKVYGPDTAMFVSPKSNMQAQPSVMFAYYKGFTVLLKEFCGKDVSLYSYAYKRLKENPEVYLEDIIAEREYNTSGKRVMWEGVDTPLKEICEREGVCYERVKYQLANWEDSSLYACVIYKEKPQKVLHELTHKGATYQFTSVADVNEFTNITVSMLNRYLKECNGDLDTLMRLVSEHKYKETRTPYTIDGVTKYREDWITHFETSETRVNENMTKYKMIFEEAVQLPVKRIMYLEVNGSRTSVKDMWLSYNLVPKIANTLKSRQRLTFKETLEHYGVDASDISIKTL